MSTKKSKKVDFKKKFKTAYDTTKDSVKKVNEFALNTTDEVVTETITMAGQWQKVSIKAIKEGFKLASTQQDIMFDALDTFKAQFSHGRKRFSKIFA